ncbi:MAG: FHA domain-containing protein [Verrucomicrobia bacterium]|nr:FHA domain-containing protein [Verrucomicrobiota bacterium]
MEQTEPKAPAASEAQAGAEAHAWLELKTGEKIPVSQSITLGRSKRCSYTFQDAQVSREHVRIELQGEGVYRLTDLESTHGTKLNRQRVDKPVLLHNGDQIEIGPYTLTFVKETKPSKASEPASDDIEATLPFSPPKACWFLILDIIEPGGPGKAKAPDTHLRLLGGWISRSKQTIDRHGGVLSKAAGSGLFAHWLSQSSAQDEHFAYCLKEFRTIQALKSPPFRLIVHYGDASVEGDEGAKQQRLKGLDVDFTFQMAKLSARLEQDCLFSKAAEQRLVRYCQLEYFGEHAFPDNKTPHAFFTIGKK